MAPSQTRLASALVLIAIVNLALVSALPRHKSVIKTETVNKNENTEVRVARQLPISVSGASAQANSFSTGSSPYQINPYLGGIGGIGGFPPISSSSAQASSFSNSGSSGFPYGK